ncbi:MAG: TRAP transporter small permease [Spirochaetia bacterium]|nr:TRAP transporter small permease [Spirochaetia bacterium]
MKKILTWLDDYFESIFMVPLLFSMSIIIGIQVFMRYVAKNSLAWSEEVSRYMFIYLMYFGISYGVRKGRHIRILVFTNLFSLRVRKILMLISDILFLIFAVIIALQSTEVAQLIARLGQITASTEISMSVVYSAVPIGFTLVTIRLMQNLVYKIRNFSSPYETFNHRPMHGIKNTIPAIENSGEDK